MLSQPSRRGPTVSIPPPTHPTNDIFCYNGISTLTEGSSKVVDTTSDSFRMYEFKVGKCRGGNSHDWTDCPYAHPGEKARRRDPRKFNYSGVCCPDFGKGKCKKHENCEYAHGVFECWLHPSRYRTHVCKDGINCRRKVCFFAHTANQLRVPTQPGHTELALNNSASELAESSPSSLGRNSVSELASTLRQLQLNKLNLFPPYSGDGSMTRTGLYSVPSTPRSILTPHGIGCMDVYEEEPAMERVESGKTLREHMLRKLRNENSLI